MAHQSHQTYMTQEYTDIHFCYFQARGNAPKARQIYEAIYHRCRIPDQSVFRNMHLKLVETGCVLTTRQEWGCYMMTDQERVDLEERIIRIIQENPCTSICDIAHQTGASWSEVWCVLSNEGLHHYHLLKVQHLLQEDYGCREKFSQ